jgi:hypothetical protein
MQQRNGLRLSICQATEWKKKLADFDRPKLK